MAPRVCITLELMSTRRGLPAVGSADITPAACCACALPDGSRREGRRRGGAQRALRRRVSASALRTLVARRRVPHACVLGTVAFVTAILSNGAVVGGSLRVVSRAAPIDVRTIPTRFLVTVMRDVEMR